MSLFAFLCDNFLLNNNESGFESFDNNSSLVLLHHSIKIYTDILLDALY